MKEARSPGIISGALVGLSLILTCPPVAGDQAEIIELQVTSIEDAGPGTLRAALETARIPGASYRIGFGDADGIFSTPQIILLESPLPGITGEVIIDGRIQRLLWQAHGATISGQGQHGILRVAPGASLHLIGVTLSNGQGRNGGAIVNEGRLVVESASLLENRALESGGAIFSANARSFLINSTIADSVAGRGGAIASMDGELVVTNATLYRNRADIGGGIFSNGSLALANTVLWDDQDQPSVSAQCINDGRLVHSVHNLFIDNGRGCGTPIIQSDPKLGRLGHFNGPTRTVAVPGDSPVINLGSNEAAIDHAGNPLVWDQRGNGDPRFAGGFTDIGAFERQSSLPREYRVNTLADNGLMGCTGIGNANCPLRAAMELAVAGREPAPVRFNPDIFASPQALFLEGLPRGTRGQHLVLDGKGAAAVTITVAGPSQPWEGKNGVTVVFDSTHTAGRH